MERQAQDMDISPGDSTPTSEPLTSSSHDTLPQGPVLLATGEQPNVKFTDLRSSKLTTENLDRIIKFYIAHCFPLFN